MTDDAYERLPWKPLTTYEWNAMRDIQPVGRKLVSARKAVWVNPDTGMQEHVTEFRTRKTQGDSK